MVKKFKPIPYELFPRNREIINGTNCLAFALGIDKTSQKGKNYNLENGDIPIEIAFLNKVYELGFNPKNFKKISTEDEAKVNGYVIRVYDFANVMLSDGRRTKDFHVIRREPNGHWVHKPGFGYCPRKVSMEDWRIIFLIYGNRFVSFAIEL